MPPSYTEPMQKKEDIIIIIICDYRAIREIL